MNCSLCNNSATILADSRSQNGCHYFRAFCNECFNKIDKEASDGKTRI